MATLPVNTKSASTVVSIGDRLLGPNYPALQKKVSKFFKNGYEEEERDFWSFAFLLRDNWAYMSKAPVSDMAATVSDIANDSIGLARKLVAHADAIFTLKGPCFMPPDLMKSLVNDLLLFSEFLCMETEKSEAMTFRPRSAALHSAERTYCVRALTEYLLAGGKSANSGLVADMVNAILLAPESTALLSKEVRDLTQDIVKKYKAR